MKPILFNTEMVRAILDGRKTVTRRVVKFPEGQTGRLPNDGSRDHLFYPCGIKYPPYRTGDILYVRETWKQATCDPAGGGYALTDLYIYKADEPINTEGMAVENRWHPSIHMPKEAARIFLRVTGVRVERLQDIDDEQIFKEGAAPRKALSEIDGFIFRSFFKDLWDSTIKKADLPLYGWEANPWVWCVSFERVSKDETMKEERK